MTHRLVFGLFFVAFLTFVSKAQTPVTFFQPASIGSCTLAVAADFNGDGNLDVACPTDTLTIWLGDGHGHFHQTSQTLPYPNAIIAAADFNGDGRPDLAIATSSLTGSQLLLLPGNGDGTFGTQIPIADVTVTALTAADVNLDRKMDLLASIAHDFGEVDTVTLLLGNGDGTFQKPASLAITTAGSTNIAVADFNGDGIPDVASMEGIDTPGMLQVVLGNGDGTFGPPIVSPLGTEAAPFAVADFTGDGILDVAWNYGFSNYVLKGNGDGTFSPGPVSPCPSFGGVGVLLTADLNGDGKPDLVLSGMGVAFNLGAGEFGPVEWYQSVLGFSGIAGDFRHLGRADLMISGDFYPNDGSGHFHEPREFPRCDCAILLPGDFNNDGNLDAAAFAGSAVLLYSGDGHGNFTGFRTSTYKLPVTDYLTVAAAADFNGDGKLDLVLGGGREANETGEAVILFGNGDGSFGKQTSAYVGAPVYALAPADFNRNGHMGLAIGLAAEVIVMAGNGAGGFTTTATIQGISNTTSLAVADFNLDGIPDLATASDVYLGNGDGTFRHSYMLPEAGTEVQIGDFNGDGIPDLATSNGVTLSIWLGIGDGTFGLPLTVTANLFQAPFLVADLNGDGFSDIAVIPSLTSTLTMYLGKGDGTFAAENVMNLPLFSGVQADGDFTNSGRIDLVYLDNLGPLLVLTNTTK